LVADFQGGERMASIDFQQARRNMVEYQIRCSKVLDPKLLDLIESMPREEFTPENLRSLAYMEGHVPLPCNQEMLSPLQEANILRALALTGSERVLEVGTGAGFLTALLAMQAESVVSCELHDELAQMATANLSRHGISNAEVIHINAMDADAMAANASCQGPFDAIVLGAALRQVPAHIEALLEPNGKIVAFIGEDPVLSLVSLKRQGQAWIRTGIFETLLPNMEGLPQKREFIF